MRFNIFPRLNISARVGKEMDGAKPAVMDPASLVIPSRTLKGVVIYSLTIFRWFWFVTKGGITHQ